jgi:hypothetical protein
LVKSFMKEFFFLYVFFVQTNHTRKELLFLMFKEINLRNHSSLHKLFYSLVLWRYNLMKELINLQKLARKQVPTNNDTISTDGCTVTTNCK